MRAMKVISAVLGALTLGPFTPAGQLSSRTACRDLDQKDTPQTMLAYLQQDRNNLQYSCIELAMGSLSGALYKPAIKTLIEYLDLQQPGPVYRARPGPTEGLYPAAEALTGFGDEAVPELKKALADDDKNKVVRTNAAETYLWLLHDKDVISAISFVAKTARESGDPDVRDALMHIAKGFARLCKDEDREKCQNALNEQ